MGVYVETIQGDSDEIKFVISVPIFKINTKRKKELLIQELGFLTQS